MTKYKSTPAPVSTPIFAKGRSRSVAVYVYVYVYYVSYPQVESWKQL